MAIQQSLCKWDEPAINRTAWWPSRLGKASVNLNVFCEVHSLTLISASLRCERGEWAGVCVRASVCVCANARRGITVAVFRERFLPPFEAGTHGSLQQSRIQRKTWQEEKKSKRSSREVLKEQWLLFKEWNGFFYCIIAQQERHKRTIKKKRNSCVPGHQGRKENGNEDDKRHRGNNRTH